ncbi:uncharacterized protein [Chironomus tepperi]|uniref:uncharacterized protein n=1 Tax=Chironomus tepperi TaxID=113505 RepID=UPI00391F3D1B
MKSIVILFNILLIILSFNITFGYNLAADEDIDITWGSINSDSVRIGSPNLFSRNTAPGTIASFNYTLKVSRIMDGIRLRSLNTTGAVGVIINGGIGYNFAVLNLSGQSNYISFVIDAFENYTSSLTTSTKVPDTVFREWGTVDYASVVLYSRFYIGYANVSEVKQEDLVITTSSKIDGLRLTSYDGTIASGEIIDGGLELNYVTVRVISNSYYLNCLLEAFRIGEYTTSVSSTTNNIITTEKPDEVVMDKGNTDEEIKLVEKRFEKYPKSDESAEMNTTIQVPGTILGLKLTSLNSTSGLWEEIGGGVNHDFVTFIFKGSDVGKPFDFNLEIFGNSAMSLNVSAFAVIMSIILLALLNK